MFLNKSKISKKWNNIASNYCELIEDLEPIHIIMFNLPIIWSIAFAFYCNQPDKGGNNSDKIKKIEKINSKNVKRERELTECNIFISNNL